MPELSTCQFYNKIGACRHGERCSKRHLKPLNSKTVILSNLYQNPKLNKNEQNSNPKHITEFFENFYKDVFVKLAGIDEVVDLVVCENENNHLNGNVYCRFKTMDGAKDAVTSLNHQWFGNRPVHCDLSPVESFADANCRAYDTNSCNRGDHCNFMHVIRPNKELKEYLFKAQRKSIAIRKLRELKLMQAQKDEKEQEQPQSTNDFKSTLENLFSVNKEAEPK